MKKWVPIELERTITDGTIADVIATLQAALAAMPEEYRQNAKLEIACCDYYGGCGLEVEAGYWREEKAA